MSELRVLIVEDDPRIADLHRRFTEKVAGYQVVGVAADYAEAREQAPVLEPDLILLDLYLPRGNGLELLKELRGAGLPVDVILITAARDAATLQGALHGGVFDYIIKPVVFSRFEEALQKFQGFRQRLGTGEEGLEQAEVDRLLHGGGSADGGGGTGPGEMAREDLPKGVDPLTLDKVQRVFCPAGGTDCAEDDRIGPEGISAESLGARLGVSRSTARRYLEYLVSAGFLEADVNYGGVGRPERRYRRR